MYMENKGCYINRPFILDIDETIHVSSVSNGQNRLSVVLMYSTKRILFKAGKKNVSKNKNCFYPIFRKKRTHPTLRKLVLINDLIQ